MSAGDYAGRVETRGRLLLHSNPNFSLQWADDWRMATADDWRSFAANSQLLGRMNEYGQQQFQRAGAAEMKLCGRRSNPPC
jgi:hypothetical protein